MGDFITFTVRSLTLGKNFDPIFLRNNNAAFHFKKAVVNGWGSISTFGSKCRSCQQAGDIAASYNFFSKKIARFMDLNRTIQSFEHVCEWLKNLILHLNKLNSSSCLSLGFSNNRGQHITDVTGDLALFYHQRPIFNNEAGVALAGNVSRQQYTFYAGLLLCFTNINGNNLSPWMIGEFEGTMEHAVKTQIIHKGFAANGPFNSFKFRAGNADARLVFK